MSALLSIGEANHAILNADAEIAHAARLIAKDATEPRRALAAAQAQLVHARAVLAAVRLAIGAQPIGYALAYHEMMAVRLREAAELARMPPKRGLHETADQHKSCAKALRMLVGGDAPLAPVVSIEEGGS